MLIYELYAQNLDACSGNYTGNTRVGLFANHENAMVFKDRWENEWVENGKTGKGQCYMNTRPELVLKVLKTND